MLRLTRPRHFVTCESIPTWEHTPNLTSPRTMEIGTCGDPACGYPPGIRTPIHDAGTAAGRMDDGLVSDRNGMPEASGTRTPSPLIMNATATSTTTLINPRNTPVTITMAGACLEGELEIPENAEGVVLFAHGSGSSRHSQRNRYVAKVIREAGIGTLLFDLLTHEEEREDDETGVLRFDIGFLAGRLLAATRWLEQRPECGGMKLGYFGASTGGAAALMAAADAGQHVSAVVSRGGRPDLAEAALDHVKCPTLLIVGGLDDRVIRWNEQAYTELRCIKELKIIPGASHLFEEPGKLEQVAFLAARWFAVHLRSKSTMERSPSDE